MSDNPIADYLGVPGSRASFHAGDNHQALPPTPPEVEPTEEEVAAILADRAQLRVPASRPRWGVDEDGVPIEAPATGLVYDPEAGGVVLPGEEPVPEPEPAPVPEPAPAPAPAPKPSTTATPTTSSGTA